MTARLIRKWFQVAHLCTLVFSCLPGSSEVLGSHDAEHQVSCRGVIWIWNVTQYVEVESLFVYASLHCWHCIALHCGTYFAWCIFWRVLALSVGATQVTRRRDPKTKDCFWDQSLCTHSIVKIANNQRNKGDDKKTGWDCGDVQTWYMWQNPRTQYTPWVFLLDSWCWEGAQSRQGTSSQYQ